jgi:hypothetical protein
VSASPPTITDLELAYALDELGWKFRHGANADVFVAWRITRGGDEQSIYGHTPDELLRRVSERIPSPRKDDP